MADPANLKVTDSLRELGTNPRTFSGLGHILHCVGPGEECRGLNDRNPMVEGRWLDSYRKKFGALISPDTPKVTRAPRFDLTRLADSEGLVAQGLTTPAASRTKKATCCMR